MQLRHPLRLCILAGKSVWEKPARLVWSAATNKAGLLLDSARQRISDVELDPNGLTPASGGAERTFTDYIGNAPVVDYREPDDDPDELFAYLPGVAEIDLGTTPRTVSYLHTDLLGSTWFKTDTGGTVTSSLVSVRTAFGEIVTLDSGVASRYGYVGAHGYEEHDYDSGDGGTTYRGDGVPDNLLGRSATDGFPFMHTGARYYDPSTGRFLQRDPIGVSGGLNVYVYCGNNPVIRIDPNGYFWKELIQIVAGVAGIGLVASGSGPLFIAGVVILVIDGITVAVNYLSVWPKANAVTCVAEEPEKKLNHERRRIMKELEDENGMVPSRGGPFGNDKEGL